MSCIEQYLTDIGRHRLLTRAEEIRLARRVQAGDAEARRRMIEANLRLVVSIARTYRLGPDCRLELLDLIQEGTVGLMRAVDRYDGRPEVKFATYAAWAIRSAIQTALAAGRGGMRVPDAVRERAADVRRCESLLSSRLGRAPETAEVARAVGLSVAEVEEARAALQPVGSLDEPVGGEVDVPVSEVVADPDAVDPVAAMERDERLGELESRLARLPERNRKVIELRFGLTADGVPRTAHAVAGELGLARERVRQIELRSLRVLQAA